MTRTRRLSSRTRAVTEKGFLRFTQQIFGERLHAKTSLSLALAALGVLHATSLVIHGIGRGLAEATGRRAKSTTKQVDRLLSNPNVALEVLFRPWIEFVVGPREEVVVALDWTDFDDDDQTTIALYLVTRHGRATPLVWKTVPKASLLHHRFGFESEVLDVLRDGLKPSIQVTVLADRGFGDQKRYAHLTSLGFDYVIRFRDNVLVSDEHGTQKRASEWLHSSGRARKLERHAVTADCYIVPTLVLVHARGMKDRWCLASSLTGRKAQEIVKLYGKRFTIEETFRDQKDLHFGMGLKATHISDSRRRDRILLLAAMAQALLTLLGEAGERAGLDRSLKVNTSPRRQLSLYRQGGFWYRALPNMPDDRADALLEHFEEVLQEHAIFRQVLGVI